jgi:uncharacterized protein (TIGR03435 family)
MALHHCMASRSLNKRLLAAIIGAASVTATISFGLASPPRIHAHSPQQTAAPVPSFEVASIRPTNSDVAGGFISYRDPGRLTAPHANTRLLILFAYHIKNFQLMGGPGWVNSQGYDIDAKVDDSLAEKLRNLPVEQQLDQKRLMMRSLLADRFKLSVTLATKELPVYALVLAKGGPKLNDVHSSSNPDDPAAGPTISTAVGHPTAAPPGRATTFTAHDGENALTAKSMSIPNLIDLLSGQLDRAILDRTTLKGAYDFTLQWAPEIAIPYGIRGPDNTPPPDSTAPSIFTALQEQLGLRLELIKGPVDTVTIDHIEQPSEN